MIGNMKIDKSSVNLDTFLQSVMILAENGGRISRYHFERQMDIYQHGHSDLLDLPEDEARVFVRRNIRTQYNKSKLPRYYGFIGLATNTEYDKPDLLITKRGSTLAKYIQKAESVNQDGETSVSCSIKPENKLDFVKLIFESILYDSFGKNNCGMETSASDVEMPKVVLKTILLLGHANATELLFIACGLDKGHFASYDEALDDVITHRKEDTPGDPLYQEGNIGIKYMTEKVREWGKYNFIQDCKFVSFFADEEIAILLKNEKEYYLNPSIRDLYINELQQLIPIYRPQQLIISGVPGNGKSYYVEKAILGNVSNPDNVIRTIIHPDYSYADFIGYVRPRNENGIKYSFFPGPLVLALKRCFLHPKENVYLIIEELNRGDFASIMGSTFQLLDRRDSFSTEMHGWSIYPIEDEIIYSYLKQECPNSKAITEVLSENTISFPANLNIIGTMNTADQNVFVLDSAFRRRFRNLYMKIDFSDIRYPESKIAKIDDASRENIFYGQHTWSEFALAVNNKIDEINSDGYTISEDKKLAPYFVTMRDVSHIRTFCDKVMYYLKNDVFLYVDGVLDESYETIYKRLVIDSPSVSPFNLMFGDDE